MVPPASDRIPPVPPYSGSCYAPRHFRIRGCHALRRAFPDPSTNVSDTTSQSYNPADAVTPAVWALPRSLATTCGITIVFSSCRYLDVSVPCVSPLMHYVFMHGCQSSGLTGSPIRISAGRCIRTARRRVSPFVASFFASLCLGIHHTPFLP